MGLNRQEVRNLGKLTAKKISPELGMGKGFNQGRAKWSNRGSQRGCQGQGNGWHNYC